MAAVCGMDDQHCSAFVGLRDLDDRIQYEGASATIEALYGITVMQREARSGPVAGGSSTDANEDDGACPLIEKAGADPTARSSSPWPHDA